MANIRHPGPAVFAEAAQPRRMALLEAATNVIVGFGLAVLVQLLAFPAFGIRVSFGENLVIGSVFTVVSLVRSYVLRRLFERVRLRGLQRETAALWRTAVRLGVWIGQLPMR